MKRISQLKAVAHHEAGHAAVSVLSWLTCPIKKPALAVKYLQVMKQDDEWAGCCRCYPYKKSSIPNEYVVAFLEWEVCIDMAGGIAEAIYRRDPDTRKCGTFLDYQNAEHALRVLRKIIGSAPTRHYVQRTIHLVDHTWPAIEAVAAALIKHKHLTGKQVQKLVLDALPPD